MQVTVAQGPPFSPGKKVTLDEPAIGDEAHLFPMDFMREGDAKRLRKSAAFQSRELLADSIESLSFQSWEFARNQLMLHVRFSPWLGERRWEINAAWQICWPLCRRGPSSTAGDGGYAGRDEITSDSTCIYGGLHRP
jgi:hypothetical protein